MWTIFYEWLLVFRYLQSPLQTQGNKLEYILCVWYSYLDRIDNYTNICVVLIFPFVAIEAEGLKGNVTGSD